MPSFLYHRPQSVDEALRLMEQGVPLGGGTRLTPNLGGVNEVVDLQDLDLARIEVADSAVTIGGTTSLQALIEATPQLPSDLIHATRLEAGWNIRNKATIAGTIVTGNGRSPLLTTLLAMDTAVDFAPGEEQVPLSEVVRREAERAGRKLITAIHARIPEQLRYAQVARSPADLPQVCVAVGVGESGVRLALGGFGSHAELKDGVSNPEQAEQWAQAAYANAGDQWASAEYRSAAAAALAARLVREVMSP